MFPFHFSHQERRIHPRSPESHPGPNILINVVSRRVKQLRRGSRPLVESLEKLSPEDIALREIVEGKISYELHTA